jgi:hypothetical protein
MAPRHAKRKGEHRTQTLLAAVFALAVALFTASAVYAGLQAQASGTESVQSGTLALALNPGDQGSGFGNTVPIMAPGDVDNIYINLTNTGTLASAAGMTLWVNPSVANALTNNSISGEGLAVTINQCSVAWSGGACNGSMTALLAQTQISAMNTSGTSKALSTPSLAALGGAAAHLQISLTLVGGNETTVNGVPPTPTIQGLGPVTLTYTFTEQQRAAITTNQ